MHAITYTSQLLPTVNPSTNIGKNYCYIYYKTFWLPRIDPYKMKGGANHITIRL